MNLVASLGLMLWSCLPGQGVACAPPSQEIAFVRETLPPVISDAVVVTLARDDARPPSSVYPRW